MQKVKKISITRELLKDKDRYIKDEIMLMRGYIFCEGNGFYRHYINSKGWVVSVYMSGQVGRYDRYEKTTYFLLKKNLEKSSRKCKKLKKYLSVK